MYNVYDNIDGRQIKYYKLGNYAQQRKETMEDTNNTLDWTKLETQTAVGGATMAPLSDEELAELLAKNPSTVFVSTDEGDEAVDPAPADVN